MAWIAGVASAGGSLIGANKAAKGQSAAIAEQRRLSDIMMNMGLPAYGKKARGYLWGLQEPRLQAWLAGKRPQVISPELEDEQWQSALRQLETPYKENRGALEQNLENRGLSYGNIATDALGDYDKKYQETIWDVRTGIRENAAKLNYAAEQEEQNQLISFLNSLYQRGLNTKEAWMGQGMNAMLGANNAQAALAGNQGSILASALGALGGGVSSAIGAYQNNQYMQQMSDWINRLKWQSYANQSNANNGFTLLPGNG